VRVSLWDEPVRDLRPLATAERNDLLQFLSNLTDDEWLAPTIAPAWTVKDIALHLLDDDLTWLSFKRDGFSGGLVDMSDPVAFPRLLAEKNQRWVDAASALSHRVVRDLLAWSGEQIDVLHAARELTGSGRVSWASDEPVPFWFNLAQEFTERWVHQQQMREAVGRVERHEARLPEVLRTFVWAFPHQLPRADGVRRVEISIDAVGVWTLAAADPHAWTLSEGSVGKPDAWLRLSADTAWRLLTGCDVAADSLTAGAMPRQRRH
jgi:uncharacterized protein (TIGR03083 family)